VDARIGVFVCHCGINIGKVVRVPEVVESAKNLPNVIYADEFLHACSQDSLKVIKEAIEKYNLNRIVVASCSPHTHNQFFQETLREAGLNKYLLEMANIRDQCSWVHGKEPDKATEKAKDLVKIKVTKLSFQEPIGHVSIDLNKSALVIGGGISGMTSALNLAESGYKVNLVQKTDSLGGMAKRIYRGFRGEDVQSVLNELMAKVYQNPLIKTHLSSDIIKVSGYAGNFVSTLSDGKKIKHGIAIIAIWGQEYKPTEYLYGQCERVMTCLELDEALDKNDDRVNKSKTIVLINCVGSRTPERQYCSRVCCHKAINLVLKIKNNFPETNIFVLYRDIRTYGFLEDKYREARSRGVIFVRYNKQEKPVVEKKADGGINVTFIDHVLQQPIEVKADLIGLAAAILPPADNTKLSRLYRAPLNEDGFFLEAHMKLRPVDSTSRGIFLAGTVHGPKNLEKNIIQAKAAAVRAARILNKNTLESHSLIAVVQPNKCAACLTCVRICLFNAPKIKNNKAEIEPSACQGCGTCVEECPHQAIILQGYNDSMYRKIIGSILPKICSKGKEGFEPKIIAFCCDY